MKSNFTIKTRETHSWNPYLHMIDSAIVIIPCSIKNINHANVSSPVAINMRYSCIAALTKKEARFEIILAKVSFFALPRINSKSG